MTEKYRPANGTEGAIFHDDWCCKCQRDRSMREGIDVTECDDDEVCQIIADTMTYHADDPKYPPEWQYDSNGRPCCTAFVKAGDPVPERCQHTVDMFGERP